MASKSNFYEPEVTSHDMPGDPDWRTISHREALKILPDLEKNSSSNIHFIRSKPSVWFNLFLVERDKSLEHVAFFGFTSKDHYDYSSIIKLLTTWKSNPPSQEILKDFEKCLDWEGDLSEEHYSYNIQPEYFDYMTEEQIIPLSKLLSYFGYKGIIPIRKGEWVPIVENFGSLGSPEFEYDLSICRVVGFSTLNQIPNSFSSLIIEQDFADDSLTTGGFYRIMREWKTRPPSKFVLKRFRQQLNKLEDYDFLVMDERYYPRTFLEIYMDYCVHIPEDYDEDFMELLVFFSGSNMLNKTFARIIQIGRMERHLFEIKNKQKIVKWTEEHMDDEVHFRPMRAKIEVGNMVRLTDESE